MKQTAALIDVLKRSLKAQAITYRELAKRLDLSESSVKRIFSERTLTLARIEQILDVLGLELVDVARLMDQSRPVLQKTFTVEQEEALVRDPRLFSFFYLLLYGRTVETILAKYRIERPLAERFLKKLETLRLLDRLPHGKVRLRVRTSIDWLVGGPLRRKYEKQIREHFLDCAFDGEKEYVIFSSKLMSAGSQSRIKRKLQLVVREMEGFADIDQNVSDEEKHMTSLMIGFRPFSFSFISGLEERR